MKPLRKRSLSIGILVLLLAGWVAPAGAATIEKLRVGQHPNFTRVVFELDAATGYRMERRVGDGGKPLIVVTLDAGVGAKAPRRVKSGSSLLRGVSLESSADRTIATLELRQDKLAVKEILLSGPPRIVLDVLGEDTALAKAQAKRKKAKPAPVAKTKPPAAQPKPPPTPVAAETGPVPPPVRKTVAKAEPPKPKPAPKPAAKPAPKPAPKPTAKPAPKPAPKPAAKPAAKPAPKPVAKPPEPKPPAKQVAKAPAAPEKPVAKTPSKAAKPEKAAAPGDPTRDRDAERAAREAMDRRLAAVREAAERRKAELEREKQESEKEGKAAPSQPGPEPAAATEAGGPNWLLIGGVAGLLIVAVVVALALSRRQKLPKDLDVTALDGLEDEGPSAADAFDIGSSESASEADFEPQTAGPGPAPPLSAPGLLDESEKGESAMDQQVDLPMDRGTPISSGGGDIGQVIAELERRLTQVESRLEESVAARERLERQVAAQSEELRVQRAAIARTQRALRGLSRSEEEQATEPALRE